jgi:hypothetical protein
MKQRRQKKIEHNLGIEFHFRQARNEAQGQSAHDQDDRIWQCQFARDYCERCYGGKQKDDGFGPMHAKTNQSLT